MNRKPIFNYRETILSAIAICLLGQMLSFHLFENDIFLFFCLFLLYSLSEIIREKHIFVWEKVFFCALICWAMFVAGWQAFIGQKESLQIIVNGISFAICIIMFVLLIVYAVLYLNRKWKFEIPFDKAVLLTISNFITMELLSLTLRTF